jgi:FAD binding domain
VRATIRDNASGRQYAVRCQYLIGADGGRRVAGLIGVGYAGLGVVTQTATLHVSAGFAPALLDTYQAERRPVDERNAQRSLENAAGHFAIGAALGLSPDNTPEQNMAQLRRMWSGRPEDAAHRSAVLRGLRGDSPSRRRRPRRAVSRGISASPQRAKPGARGEMRTGAGSGIVSLVINYQQ